MTLGKSGLLPVPPTIFDTPTAETPHPSAIEGKWPVNDDVNSGCAGKKAVGAPSNLIDGAISGKIRDGLRDLTAKLK